jgi:hypothetical protein
MVLHEDSGVQRVTVPRNHSRLQVPGWVVHRGEAEYLTRPDRVRVTTPTQTVMDLARVLTLPQAVVAGDDALRRRLVTLAVLLDLARARKGRGRTQIMAAVTLLDPASGSVLESLFRVLVVSAGLPSPATQVQLADGLDVLGRFDFCWREQRLVVELDGFAFHADRVAFRRDRELANALERLGWRLLRFTWEDVLGRPAYVVALLDACLGAGHASHRPAAAG